MMQAIPRWIAARLASDARWPTARDLLVITGLGSPTYDVRAAGDHDGNFYLWGAMGGAADDGARAGAGAAEAPGARHHRRRRAS